MPQYQIITQLVTIVGVTRNHCKCNTSNPDLYPCKLQHCVSINQQCQIYNNCITNFDLQFSNCKSKYVT